MVISRIKNNRFLSKTPIFTTVEITNFWWIYSRWFYIGGSQTWFLKKSEKFKFWKKYLIKLYELKTVPKNEIAINLPTPFPKITTNFSKIRTFRIFEELSLRSAISLTMNVRIRFYLDILRSYEVWIMVLIVL